MSEKLQKLNTEWGKGFMFAMKGVLALVLIGVGIIIAAPNLNLPSITGVACTQPADGSSMETFWTPHPALRGLHIYWLAACLATTLSAIGMVWSIKVCAKYSGDAWCSMAIILTITFAVCLIFTGAMTWTIFDRLLAMNVAEAIPAVAG